MAVFQRSEPGLCVDVLAKRSAVPYEATDPVYRKRNERLLTGLRLASDGLASDGPASEGLTPDDSERFKTNQPRLKDVSATDSQAGRVETDRDGAEHR